ncbi:MAG TPA: TraB/GumN family protein, partial [Dokdonella sp.]|nr:TraB/GumN family protein [Dokdonella sp.]
MRRILLAALLGAFTCARAAISDPAPPGDDHAALAAIVVTGEQPGPGLWKVSKDGHVMWVLGTLSPLPKRFAWRTAEIERRIGESGHVLMAPQVKMEANVGFFGRLALLPSLIGVRDIPGGARLADVLPAPSYERWRVLKQRYIGRSAKVERWRPIFAARELYVSAIESAGLAEKPIVTDAVRKAAKKAGVELVPVVLEVGIDAPKAALK